MINRTFSYKDSSGTDGIDLKFAQAFKLLERIFRDGELVEIRQLHKSDVLIVDPSPSQYVGAGAAPLHRGCWRYM